MVMVIISKVRLQNKEQELQHIKPHRRQQSTMYYSTCR